MEQIFQANDYVAVHENPVWRNKSNFIIRAYLEKNEGRNEWEQLWVQQIEEKKFIICCIPFYIYNLALGDEVQTDDNYILQAILKPSGQSTFRVWFGDSSRTEAKGEVLRHFEEVKILLEWSSANLLAINAKDDIEAQEIANYLSALQSVGDLVYETGRI